jgi:hypothetical protein
MHRFISHSGWRRSRSVFLQNNYLSPGGFRKKILMMTNGSRERGSK